jgi:hypothetical protein
VLGAGVVLAFLIICFKNLVYSGFDLPLSSINLIYYVVPIMFVDAICVIPFLKLRLERRAKTFAAFKLINICVNVALNLFLILKLKWGIEAVFVSNLAASLVSFVLTFPIALKNIRIKINTVLLKRLLKLFLISLPLLPQCLSRELINRFLVILLIYQL